jgi:hypothetical protein
MANPAPHAHRVRLREIATGRVFDAWPVDARELLTHPKQEFEAVPPDTPVQTSATAPLAAPTPPPPPPTAAQRIAALGEKERHGLAKRAGVKVSSFKTEADLIQELARLAEAGTIALDGPPPLKLPDAQFPHAET